MTHEEWVELGPQLAAVPMGDICDRRTDYLADSLTCACLARVGKGRGRRPGVAGTNKY